MVTIQNDMTNEEAISCIEDMANDLQIFPDSKQGQALLRAIKALEQEPCEDCISRQAVLDCLTASGLKKFDFILDTRDKIKNLPPVTPKPKTGHWKFIQRGKFIDICCSECGYVSVKDYAYNYTIDQLDEQEKKEFFAEAHMNFCECCGVKMVEPQESEE